MVDSLRKKLEKRSRDWNTKKPCPSEVKSERLKKKLARGVPIVAVRQTDCCDCTKYPCGKTLEVCGEVSKVDRCAQCGVKVLFRYIAGVVYYCPICKVKR